MKILKLHFFAILFTSAAVLSGCKDDPQEVVSPFVGNYVISHAETTESFTLNTVEGTQVPVPIGSNITLGIQNALLGSVNCTSADKTWIELRKDNSMFMSCELQNELNAGTWQEISATELKLNMNSAAVPSSPSGVVLNVTEMVKVTNTWTGKTSVPLPKEMFAASLQGYGFTIADTPAIYMVAFSISFVQK